MRGRVAQPCCLEAAGGVRAQYTTAAGLAAADHSSAIRSLCKTIDIGTLQTPICILVKFLCKSARAIEVVQIFQREDPVQKRAFTY